MLPNGALQVVESQLYQHDMARRCPYRLRAEVILPEPNQVSNVLL